MLVGAGFAMEGLSVVTGGEVYLASVRHLAEAATAELQHETAVTVSPQPSPPPPPQPQLPPPPPPSEPAGTSSSIIVLPTPPPAIESSKPSTEPQNQTLPPQPVPPESKFGHEEEDSQQDFVDPRELQQVFREIRDMRSQIKQLANQLRKQPAFADELIKITAVAAELEQFNTAIRSAVSSGTGTRAIIQDFRDNQYWDLLNAIRAKVQLPQEIKQIEMTLRRLERTIKVKSLQNIGLTMGLVEAKIAEMKNQVGAAKSAVAAGNIEEAQEAMQSFHEGGHPGEIEGTIYRVRDIKQMLKRVKDEQVRAEVDRVLQEVIDAFNAGEYLDARETLDEYADDLQRLIQRFFTARMLQGKNRADSLSKIRNLDALIRAKLDEPDSRQPQSAPVAQPRQ